MQSSELTLHHQVEKKEVPVVQKTTGLTLRMSAAGELMFTKTDGTQVRVQARPSFPWSDDEGYFGLFNAENEELGYVENIDKLDVMSADALRKHLRSSRFIFEIRSIVSIEEDYELRLWVIETQLGVRKFQTKLDEWPQLVPGGTYIVQDLSGDLYRIPRLADFDARSQKLLWAYVD